MRLSSLLVQAICAARGGEYEIACEHSHSLCILLAKVDRFKIEGQWWTHIDYERFHELVRSGQKFTSLDYIAKTPAWAVFVASEQGFDPEQARFKKERRHPGKSTTLSETSSVRGD